MFHLLEDGVRGALHGQGFLDAIQAEAFTSVGGVMARLLFVFFAFIPFFALMDFLGSAHYPITLRKIPTRWPADRQGAPMRRGGESGDVLLRLGARAEKTPVPDEALYRK